MVYLMVEYVAYLLMPGFRGAPVSGSRRPPLGRVLRVRRRAEFSDLLCTAMHDSIPLGPARTR